MVCRQSKLSVENLEFEIYRNKGGVGGSDESTH